MAAAKQEAKTAPIGRDQLSNKYWQFIAALNEANKSSGGEGQLLDWKAAALLSELTDDEKRYFRNSSKR